MPLHILSGILHAAECGLLPDRMLRVGIRRLLKLRLREINRGNCEAWQTRLDEYLQDARTGPIAPVPGEGERTTL